MRKCMLIVAACGVILLAATFDFVRVGFTTNGSIMPNQGARGITLGMTRTQVVGNYLGGIFLHW